MAATTDRYGPADKGPEEILRQVDTFVKGSRFESRSSNEEIARSALYLLQFVPAARSAVLEHLSSVFDEAVNSHLVALELGSSTDSSDSLDPVISEVQTVIMSFVNTNSVAWAPIISAWSIEVLGQISSKYSDRRGVPASSNLNEVLQLWMTCKATKALIEVASECLAAMVSSSPDVCVDALLEASVKHSPHFDWVVAHIGSCFPSTVISRVLRCGLKDYCDRGNSKSKDAGHSMGKEPKLASVVGILGHLAAQHGPQIKQAIITLFQESLREGAEEMDCNTAPFLLQLASMSPLLLTVIASEFTNTVTADVLVELVKQSQHWKTKGDTNGCLVGLVVHLLTRCTCDIYSVIKFLFDCAVIPPGSDKNASIIASVCCQILDLLLLDLQRVCHHFNPSTDYPVLQGLQEHIGSLCAELMSDSPRRSEWACRLLACVSLQCGETTAAQIFDFLLCQAETRTQLGIFIRLQQDLQIRYPNILHSTLSGLLSRITCGKLKGESCAQVVQNLNTIIRWEKQPDSQMVTRSRLSNVITQHLDRFCELLYKATEPVAMATIELLSCLGVPPQIDMSTMLHLSGAVTHFYFSLMPVEDSLNRPLQLCVSYLRELCGKVAAQRAVLRFLLEGCLKKELGYLFGTFGSVHTEAEVKKIGYSSLLQENLQKGQAAMLPHSHSVVFHAGTIGNGPRIQKKPRVLPKSHIMQHRQLVLDTLWQCATAPNISNNGSQPPGQSMTPQTAHFLALLMIELTVPDVLYNGIPWPEEEFMKVTVERDLVIRKQFDENPLLWEIMFVICSGPGAACFCSVILRGVMATLLAQWDSCREKVTRNAPKYLDMSCQLIRCMNQGKLLPRPLCHMDEMLPQVTPFEAFLLLHNVWRYIKENPPIPDKQLDIMAGCDARYTELMNSILHSNINKLGHLYSKLFPLGPT